MTLEVMFRVVDTDAELFSNGLAVDFVDQQVHFIRDNFKSTDVVGVRVSRRRPVMNHGHRRSSLPGHAGFNTRNTAMYNIKKLL